MKINDSNYTLPNLNSETAKRDKTLEKIASAVETGIQDNASRMIADMLQGDISNISQGLSNANDAVAMMQIADSALSDLSKQAQSLNDMSVQYNSAALNSDQKRMLEGQFNATVDTMNQTIASTTYNGDALFGSNRSFSLGDSNLSVTLNDVGTGSLSIGNQNSITDYLDRLSQTATQVGSTTNALTSSTNAMLSKLDATTAAKSQLSDTDLAEAISDFQKSGMKLNLTEIAISHQYDALRQTIGRLLG